MSIKNRISVLFLCILILGACGDGQSIVEENTNTSREGAETLISAEPGASASPLPESQTGSEGETQAEAQEGITGVQAFEQNRWLTINNVDWEAYQKVLSEEDYAILQKYFPVLREEASFTWTELVAPDEVEVEKRTVTLAEFAPILNYDLRDSDELQLDSLTLCDVDGDGDKELILYLTNQNGIFLILKEKDGTYYGTYTVLRGFEALQTNGVYVGVDGAADAFFCRMYFEEGVFRQVVLGHAWQDGYKMGNEQTTDEEIFLEWLDSIMSEEAVFYKPQIKANGNT